MTQYIKAPFNFVPVSEKVFSPDWADQISQDIPFSDGESGELELTITAHSPIFVRNGHTKKDAEEKSPEYKSFSKSGDNKYFIPATTIKGAIRNVLEIISFGKMDSINNNRFSLRDLDNKAYMNEMKNIHCGWLSKKEGEYIINNHGIPRFISHKDIDDHYLTDLVGYCSNEDNLREDANRLASKKYSFFEGADLSGNFREYSKDDNPRKFARFSDQGGIPGTIVLTGQASARKETFSIKKQEYVWSGKFYEFVFFKKEISNCKFDEDSMLWQDFLFNYKKSSDWDYWKKKLNAGKKIPIFFRIKDDELVDFGLSYLYKLPYNKRIKDCLPGEQRNEKNDLADCIFGTTGRSQVKGRVQFKHADLVIGKPMQSDFNPLMGTPRASYFPIYLQQEGQNELVDNRLYITYANSQSFLKGWKRYPIHNSISSFPNILESQRKNLSPFIPIESLAVFSANIRFHNLKSVELGALIYAITFNDSDAFHSLGFCKPFGFGKVKMQIKNLNKYMSHISLFETKMNEFVVGWKDTPQMKELLLMAREHTKVNDEHLSYMALSEFVAAKKKENPPTFLNYYSGSNYQLPSEVPITVNSIPLIAKLKFVDKASQPKDGWMQAVVYDDKGKTAKLIEGDSIIQLITPIEKQNQKPKKDQKIWVTVKQKSKDERIVQVQFESIVIN